MPSPVSAASKLAEDVRDLARFGYRPQFERAFRPFDSFAIGYSFISITTGIFTTFGFLLTTSGPRGIWTWPIVIAGQALVALVYGALARRMPLAGSSYQWASRLIGQAAGWWLGWLGFAFLAIVTVSVDYACVQQAFEPLAGITHTPTTTALLTLVVLALQAVLIAWSTRIVSWINNTSVVVEVVGIIQVTIMLFSAVAALRRAHWHNLVSTVPVGDAGWFRWLGPGMLATLLGAYTIVGFESSATIAEETQEPRRVVPSAMLRAVLLSGAVGMIFLVVLTVGMSDIKATSLDGAPVAFVLGSALGPSIRAIFLIFVTVSIFACGLVIMVTNSRLIHAMARDRRLPGHRLLSRVPRATGGPTWATVLAAAVSGMILLIFAHDANTLATLFSASTLMPAILYTGTVLVYVRSRRRLLPSDPLYPDLGPRGRWIAGGALLWLAYELVILIGPSQFRPAQLYVLGVCVLGGAVYGLGLLFEPVAMRRPLAPSVQAPLTGPVDDAGRVDAGGGLSDTGPFSKVDPDQWRPTRRPSAPDGLAPTRIRFELTPELARRRLPNLPNAVVVVQGAVVNVDTATPVETLAALTTWMRKAGVVQLPNLVTQRLPDPRLRPVG